MPVAFLFSCRKTKGVVDIFLLMSLLPLLVGPRQLPMLLTVDHMRRKNTRPQSLKIRNGNLRAPPPTQGLTKGLLRDHGQ